MLTPEQIRTALQDAELPYQIVGAVLFGTHATKSASVDSDVDLFVVANGVHPKRHRRGSEIAQLKQNLPPLSLDVLFVSPEEADSNFRNHNPLYLDIAVEGILILDNPGWIEDWMQKTRTYIHSRGIQRHGDGWKFPVKRGVPTPLSKVSNFEFAQAMLPDGRRDFEIGITIIESGHYDKAVYHFQQTVEKGTKAVLISFGVFRKTHFVGDVLRQTLMEVDLNEEWEYTFLEAAQISESIESEVSLSRYPGIMGDELWLPANEYELQDAERARSKAERVLAISTDFIEDWFDGD